MVLEDYTLKHVWGLRTSTVQRIYKDSDSDPDQGFRLSKFRPGRVYICRGRRRHKMVVPCFLYWRRWSEFQVFDS